MPQKQGPSNTAVESRDLLELQAFNAKVGLSIWDIPGEEQTMPLNRMYIRDTNAAIILYDVTNADSLEHC
jgi:GTPase SAR1 family protein